MYQGNQYYPDPCNPRQFNTRTLMNVDSSNSFSAMSEVSHIILTYQLESVHDPQLHLSSDVMKIVFSTTVTHLILSNWYIVTGW